MGYFSEQIQETFQKCMTLDLQKSLPNLKNLEITLCLKNCLMLENMLRTLFRVFSMNFSIKIGNKEFSHFSKKSMTRH